MSWRDDTDDFQKRIVEVETIPQLERVNLDLWEITARFLRENPKLHDELVWLVMRPVDLDATDLNTKVTEYTTGCFVAWAALLDGARPSAPDLMFGQGVQVHVVLDKEAQPGTKEFGWSKVLIQEYGQLALGLSMDEAKWINDIQDNEKVLDVMEKTAAHLRSKK